MSEWIEWKGGECPVGGCVPVAVKFRSGSVDATEVAGDWHWNWIDSEGDIVAYRLSGGQQSTGALDEQHGGDHYKKMGDYQPWEVLRRWLTPEEFRGYMKGEAITYLARERSKGGSLDISKAAHTLKAMLELEGK